MCCLTCQSWIRLSQINRSTKHDVSFEPSIHSSLEGMSSRPAVNRTILLSRSDIVQYSRYPIRTSLEWCGPADAVLSRVSPRICQWLDPEAPRIGSELTDDGTLRRSSTRRENVSARATGRIPDTAGAVREWISCHDTALGE